MKLDPETVDELMQEVGVPSGAVSDGDAPIGWFPIKPSNLSKLTAHKFVDGEWKPMVYVRYVRAA